MNTIRRIYESNRQFLLYGIIGSCCATLDFLVYMAMVYGLGEKYILIANVAGVLCGIAMSFYLNRRYNFKVTDHTAIRFVSFLSVGLTGMAISTFLLYIFIERFAGNTLVSKILTIFIVAVFQFIINKYITFKIKNNESGKDLHSDAGL